MDKGKPFFRTLLLLALTGIGGVILLVGFFSLFMDATGLVVFLPLLTGFNGMVTGYNLIEKLEKISWPRLTHGLFSLLYALVGVLGLRLFFPLVFAQEWWSVLTASAVFTFLAGYIGMIFGNWIAKKKRQSDRH